MPLVLGVDSSTQSCKVVVCDADTGAVVREGRAPHAPGVEADPADWERALHAAIARSGGAADVAAIGIGGQQHGLVALDEAGRVVRPALLWNDTRAATSAHDLVNEFGGAQAWADAVGSVPVASFTVAKLRWLAEHEPDNAARVTTACLPHDWLTWRLSGARSLDDLRTDRGDASGTGYWSPATGEYRPDLLTLAFGRDVRVPRVLGAHEAAGHLVDGATLLAPGTGDNAAAALGLGAEPGEVIVSIGTSGVASARAADPSSDPSGTVAGFASATEDFLPLVCTLNAARVLDAAAALLGVDHATLSGLALGAEPGAGGVVLVPWFDGERTPNRPDATASLHGLTLATTTPAHLARAAVEGLLCGLADGVDALPVAAERILLIGGGARAEAVQRVASTIFGRPVEIPEPGEYVALGAARQAAWTLAGTDAPPPWPRRAARVVDEPAVPAVRERYAAITRAG